MTEYAKVVGDSTFVCPYCDHEIGNQIAYHTKTGFAHKGCGENSHKSKWSEFISLMLRHHSIEKLADLNKVSIGTIKRWQESRVVPSGFIRKAWYKRANNWNDQDMQKFLSSISSFQKS